MIKAVRHIGLVVADLDAAVHFWHDILGLKIERRADECGAHLDAMLGLKDVRVTTIKLSAPDKSIIELLYFDSHPDKPQWDGQPFSTGFTHVALEVDNLDQIWEKLSGLGMTFPAKPQLTPDGYAKVIYGKGPEGVLLELVEVLNQ